MHDADRASRGVFFGILAFSTWGLTPLYFKAIDHVSASEILVHRVVWTVLLVGTILAVTRRTNVFFDVLADKKKLALLALSGSTLAINWWVFTWAVTHQRVLETSLGYFINPLFNVVLGVVLFRERLRPAQLVAVLLATFGVGYLIVDHGALPWVSLVLPVTFGLYGVIRKQLDVDPLGGLLTEMVAILPVGLAYGVYLAAQGGAHFGPGFAFESAMLPWTGVITAFPLSMFALAARRIQLSTIGFIQYIAPSLNFVLAVFVFAEPFARTQMVTFSFIWLSLAIFTFEGVRFSRLGARRAEIANVAE